MRSISFALVGTTVILFSVVLPFLGNNLYSQNFFFILVSKKHFCVGARSKCLIFTRNSQITCHSNLVAIKRKQERFQQPEAATALLGLLQ